MYRSNLLIPRFVLFNAKYYANNENASLSKDNKDLLPTHVNIIAKLHLHQRTKLTKFTDIWYKHTNPNISFSNKHVNLYIGKIAE